MEYEEEVEEACEKMSAMLEGCDKDLASISNKTDLFAFDASATERNQFQSHCNRLKEEIETLKKSTLENMGQTPSVSDDQQLLSLEMAARLLPVVTETSTQCLQRLMGEQSDLEARFAAIKESTVNNSSCK